MWRMFEQACVAGEQILTVSEGRFQPTAGGLGMGMPTGDGEPGAIAVTDRALLVHIDGENGIGRHSYWELPVPRLKQYRIGLSQSMAYGLLPISRNVVFFIGTLGMRNPWPHAQQLVGHAERAWHIFHASRHTRPPFAPAAKPDLPLPEVHARIQIFLQAARGAWPTSPPLATPNGSGPLGDSYTFAMAGLPIHLRLRMFGEAGPAVVVSAPVVEDVHVDTVPDDVLLRLASQPETMAGWLRLVASVGGRTDLVAIEVIPARALAAVDLAVALHAVHRAALRGYTHHASLGGRPVGEPGGWTAGPDCSIPGGPWPDQLAPGDPPNLLARLGSTAEIIGFDGDPAISGNTAIIGSLVLNTRRLGPVPCAEMRILYTDPKPAADLPPGYGRHLMSHPVGPLDLYLYGNAAFDKDVTADDAAVWLARHAVFALYEGVQTTMLSALTRLAGPDDHLQAIVDRFT